MAASQTPSLPLAAAKSRPARELSVDLVFGPLADLVNAVLLPLRVPPAGVVLVHAAAGLGAALAILRGELVAAALLLVLKTVLDNADGRLARSSGRVSLLGRYLDTEADLVVNAAVFAALGAETGSPWLALTGFAALTLVLSVDFNLSRAYRAAKGNPVVDPPPSGSRVERALARIYAVVFGPQDRLLGTLSARRLERILDGEHDAELRRRATLAYYDGVTMAVLANLGLSTQLLALAVCLALGMPVVYLWLAVASGLLLPVLQLRRERLALSVRRAA